IRAVSTLDESILQRKLERLVEAELLYQRGVPPKVTYVFKHALIQEAAYQSLVRGTRQQYHQRIARAMIERFPAEAEARPEFVAHHFTEAGLNADAVVQWQAARRRAVERSAYTEAVAHFTKSLAALNQLQPSFERDHQELALQVALAAPLIAVNG